MPGNMPNTVDLSSDIKLPFSVSSSPLSRVKQTSMPNIDIHASDGRHTETPQALRDPVNDHYRYDFSQNDSVSTTGKESESKATRTGTARPEIPSENRKSLMAKIKDEWYVELGACLISAIAMATLIIVIGRHNGKPLPKWPLHITIATFIAICSTITKLTLLVPVVCTSHCVRSPDFKVMF